MIALIRARVISSFSASGVIGRKSPRCAERGGAGSAIIQILVTGAPGGLDAKSSCSNFQEDFGVAHGNRQPQSARHDRGKCHIVGVAELLSPASS